MPNAKDVTTEGSFFRVMVTGDYGTGKSVFASTFPTPGYVFDFDKGILTYRGKDFDYDQFPYTAQGWVEFDKKYREIKDAVEGGKYKTVIIDSTTTMEEIAMARALQLDPSRYHEGPQWNVHYSIVKNLMAGKLRGFMNWPCNFVLIAHLIVETDQESGAIIGISPKLTGQLRESVPGLFDEVYFATTRKTKDAETRYVLQTVTVGHKKARSRISGVDHVLPNYIDNDYEAIVEAIEKGGGKKAAKK